MAATPTSTSVPTTVDPNLPVDGGVLGVAVSEVSTLDPAQSNIGSATDLLLADLIFDGLTDIAVGETEASPAIAREWTAAANWTKWTFVLDTERTFSDGTPITAEDVAFTLQRARASFGLVAQPLSVIESVKAVDGRTVRVVLKEPTARLAEFLAAPSLGIVSKRQVSDHASRFLTHPIGSGPFGLVEGTQDGVRLSATSDGTHLAAVELIETGSGAAAWDLQQDGEVDLALVPDAEPSTKETVTAPFRALIFFGINVKHPSLADPAVRQALVAAVDADAVVSSTLADRAEPATGVGADADGCGPLCDHDADSAAAMAAEVADGLPTLHVDHRDDPAELAIAEAVVGQLRSAGFSAETRAHAATDYGEYIVSGEHEIFTFGHVGIVPVGDAYLPLMFGSKSANNVTGVGSETLDQALADAAGSVDGDAWNEVEAQVMEQAPVIPLARYLTRWSAGERVRDLEIDRDGTFDPAAVWVVDE